MVLENNKLSFTRNDADMIEFSKTVKSGFAKPEVWNIDIPFDTIPNAHAVLLQNFVDAILDGTPLIDLKPDRTLFKPIAPPQKGDYETGQVHMCKKIDG